MSYFPPAIRSAAADSASTGRAIRRDRYQASAPATTSPTPRATKSNSTSESHPWVSSVFFFATISAPNTWSPILSGCPTARKVLLSPGGVKSNVTTLPSWICSHRSEPIVAWDSCRSPDV